MKTVSGKVISTTPVSLSDAAVILSDFAATETGASDAVSVYIRRAADAFNQLVQFHNELRALNSGPKRLGKEHLGDDNSEYRLKRSTNREIVAKEEEESVKVEQFPEGNYQKKKHKKQGNDKIRDLDVKNEALVKIEPDSVAIEEHRINRNYGAEKVKNEDKIKSEKGLNRGEEDRVGISNDGKYQENKFEKVKTESSLKNEAELDEVEGYSKKKDKKKKKKKKKLSEGNEGVGAETFGVETEKVETESSLKNEAELDEVEGDSMKKKDKKKKKKKLSERNDMVEGETLGVETKKRKSGEIDGGLACGSAEQNSKRKSKKQRVEGK